MTEYGLDIDAAQIVRWLKDELAAGSRWKLRIRATREYATERVADLDEAGIGEDQDVASLTTIGTLEVQPVGVEHRWVLRVRIEDVVGPHLPEDESVPEDAEEIDLETFDSDFIAPDAGTAYVSLESETPQGKHAFDQLLSEMIVSRHGG